MASNLTCRFLAKEYMRVTNTTDDALIDRLIDYVSAAIEQYCGRTFGLTTYRKWYSGNGKSTLTLPDWPITRVYGVSLSSVNVGTITFTGGQWATVGVHDDTVYLSDITAGTENDNEVSLTTATTISAVETAVELVSGWSMTVTGDNGDQPSRIIRPVYGEWALSADTVDIDIPDQAESARVTDESSQVIERSIGLTFPQGISNVFVWYKAGYTLPVGTLNLSTAGNVPADLTLVANEAVKASFDTSKQNLGAYRSEKMGNYSYTLSENAKAVVSQTIINHKETLALHRSMKVT